jgi:uncharacterized protein with ParB-like and HNH nuclease domain
MKNTCRLISFETLISDSFFVIPDYQRGFTWDTKNLMDLKSDIENTFDKDYNHFMGTIVLREIDGERNEFEVVDGQQRLTSLIILLKVLMDKHPKYSNHFNKYIFRGIIGNENYVLKTNYETWDFFRQLIYEKNNNPPIEYKSHSRLLSAKKFIEDWLSSDPINIEKIFKTVLSKLGFIVFNPPNTENIGIMFEVINNRGKGLSELEKIKNYFIYYSTIFNRKRLHSNINEKWAHILNFLNKAGVEKPEEEDNFLRYCYIVFFKASKSKSHHVYDDLKDVFDPYINIDKDIDENIKKMDNFIDFLESASRHYAYYLNKNGFFENNFKECRERNKIEKSLKQLRSHPVNASIMPVYLAVMSHLNDLDEVIELLEIIEILNFRVYVLPKVTSRNDSKQSEMFGYAYSFYHYDDDQAIIDENSTFENKFDWLKTKLKNFTKKYCNERKFIQSLTIDEDELAEDYYQWNGLKYFLSEYEADLREREGKESWDIQNIFKSKKDGKDRKLNDILTKEHIWAVENYSDKFGKDHKEKRRLGNFVLLGLSKNIKKKNKDIDKKYIEEKVVFLQDENKKRSSSPVTMFQVSELKEICDETIKYVTKVHNKVNRGMIKSQLISTKINDERETRMIKFALKRWSFKDEKFDSFDKVDSDYVKNNNIEIRNYVLKSDFESEQSNYSV